MHIAALLLALVLGGFGLRELVREGGSGKIAAVLLVFGFVLLMLFKQLKEDPDQRQEISSTFKRLGPAGWLGLLWGSLPAVAGILLLRYMNQVSLWLEDQGPAGLWIYIGAFILSAGIGLLPTFSQAALGGWRFGFTIGTPAALTGFGGASLIGYVIAKTVAKDRVRDVIADHPKWQAVRDALVGQGFWRTLAIVTLVRIPPNSPFALTNLVLASVGVKIVPYILGTLVGMAPRTAIAVWVAAQLQQDGGPFSIEELKREGGWIRLVAMVVSALLVIGVIGHIANRAVERVTASNSNGKPDATDEVQRDEAEGVE